MTWVGRLLKSLKGQGTGDRGKGQRQGKILFTSLVTSPLSLVPYLLTVIAIAFSFFFREVGAVAEFERFGVDVVDMQNAIEA